MRTYQQFIKPVVEFLVSPLIFVINNYRATNNFRDAWKTEWISLILKMTQPVKLKDYRPVSILPSLSKFYEKLVLQQLAALIKRESIYNQYQSSYWKNHSAATLLSNLRDDIKKLMKSSEVTIAIFYWILKGFWYQWFSCFNKKDAYTKLF